MRFKVPQNIDIPNRILLGLSFTQMMYLGGAVGFCLFLLLIGNIIFVMILGTPVVILALLLAFFRHNEQPFSILLYAMVRFFMNKKKYIWKQEQDSGQQGVIRTRLTRDSSNENLKRTIKTLEYESV